MGLLDWFFDDVLDIDFDVPKQQRDGQDVDIYSTESYLPEFVGTVKDAKPVCLAFAAVSDDATGDDRENDLLHQVFVFGKHCLSIDAVRVDGIDSESSDWQDENGNRWLHVRKFPNGMDSYTWDLLTKAGFKDSYKFTECTCVYVVAEFGSDVVTSRPSDVRIDLTAKPLKSVLGNSTGAQRYHNNASVLYNYLTELTSGPNWSTDSLNLSSWNQAAELCDIQLETYESSGEFEDRYSYNGSIDTAKQVHEIISDICSSMRAHMPFNHSTGKYDLIVEDDTNYESVDILDADIDSIKTTDSADVGKKVNQVVVKFPDANQNGKVVEVIYPPEGSATEAQWLAEDNHQRKSKTITLNGCNSYYQAMQQAKIEAENSREGLQARVNVKPSVYKLMVAKVVRVTNKKRGWNRKPFRILSKTLYENLSSELILREHQPTIFDYHNTGEKPYFPDSNVIALNLPNPTNINIVESSYGGMKANWVAENTKFQYRVKSVSGAYIDFGEGKGFSTELRNLVDGNAYKFLLRTVNNTGQSSQWVSHNFIFSATIADIDTTRNPLVVAVVSPDVGDLANSADYVWKVYFSTTDFGAKPNYSAAQYGGLIDYNNGQTFEINSAIPNTIYYVWFGLLKKSQSNEEPSFWVKKAVRSGEGLSSEYLSQDLRDLLTANGVVIDLTPLEQGLEDLEEDIDEIIENTIFTTAKQQEHVTDATKNSAAIRIAEEAIANSDEARATLGEQLSAQIETERGRISSSINEINQVKVDIKGNAEALSVVTAELSSVDDTARAGYQIAQQAKIDGQGNAQSITSIQNDVYDGATGLSATAALALLAKQTADGNVTSVAELQASINDIVENGAPTTAALQLAVTGNTTEINSLKAEAFLFTDANGRIAGIKASSSAELSSLDFIGERIRFLNNDGSYAFRLNTITGEWEFNGSGNFNGTVKAENIIGEQASGAATVIPSIMLTNSYKNVVSFTVSAASWARNVIIPCPYFVATNSGSDCSITVDFRVNGANLYTDGLLKGSFDSGYFTGSPRIYHLPANTSATFTVDAKLNQGSGDASVFTQGYSPQIFKNSNQISFN